MWVFQGTTTALNACTNMVGIFNCSSSSIRKAIPSAKSVTSKDLWMYHTTIALKLSINSLNEMSTSSFKITPIHKQLDLSKLLTKITTPITIMISIRLNMLMIAIQVVMTIMLTQAATTQTRKLHVRLCRSKFSRTRLVRNMRQMYLWYPLTSKTINWIKSSVFKTIRHQACTFKKHVKASKWSVFPNFLMLLAKRKSVKSSKTQMYVNHTKEKKDTIFTKIFVHHTLRMMDIVPMLHTVLMVIIAHMVAMTHMVVIRKTINRIFNYLFVKWTR